MRLAGSSSGGYLMCVGRERGICENRTTFRYRAFEETVLDEFLDFAMDDSAFANKSEAGRLSALIAEREIAHAVKMEEARGHFRRASKSPISEQMGFAAEAEATALAANISALRQQREDAKGRANAAEHLARVSDMRDRLFADINLRRKVMQAFNTVIERVSFGSNGVATLRLIGGIMEVKIDRQGNAFDGSATLTLRDDLLAELGDDKVINIARSVTQRFAAKFQNGGTNWNANAA